MFRKIALLLLICATVQAQSNPSPRSEVPSVGLMSKILEAWNTGGPGKAAPFYDKAPTDSFYDIRPLKYRAWSAYAKGAEQDLRGFEYLNLRLNDDTQVHRAGNIAWGTATWTGEGKLKNGNKLGLEGRWTVIWEKKNSRWLIVHEHLSIPWQPESESRQR